jgi:hypothetical protein
MSIQKIAEAYKSMVSENEKNLEEASCGTKMRKEKQECPKCEGKGCDHCDDKGYHEEKELDPVNDKENDKKFKDRKDKDIDNDGDVDSSDEYLHKRRAATDDAIDARDGKEDKDDKKKKDKNPRTSDKTAEISKIGEKVTTKEEFDALWSKMEEAVNPKKGATDAEKMDDKQSPKSKEFVAKHTIDKKDHDELEKVEEPKKREVKKEDVSEYEVIRRILSGQVEE